MTATPEEGREVLFTREVYRGSSDNTVWMSRKELRRTVKMGNGRYFAVVVYDDETETPSLCCAACAVGLRCLGSDWVPKVKWSEWSRSRSPVAPLLNDEKLVCPSRLDLAASGVVLH